MKQDDINEIAHHLSAYGLAVQPNDYNSTNLLSAVSSYVNELITNDFAKLIQLLYRSDISEEQLSICLQGTTTTLAANIIAEMIIERQHKKIEAKKSYKAATDIPDDERW